MKKSNKQIGILILTILLSIGINKLNAQQNKELINAQLQTEQAMQKWLPSDISDYVISDQYTDEATKLTYAYIQQRHNKIIVYNAISLCLIKDNKVLHFTPGIIDHLAQKVKTDKPTISPEAAIGYALIHLGRNEIAPVKQISTDVNTNTLIYESTAISASPIKVQLVYRAMDEGVFLSWDVSIEMKNEPHWWNVRINALTGDYLDKNDFVANCNYDYPNDKCAEHNKDMESPSSPFSPLLPPPVPAEYTVFPFPIEAPSFGIRSLLSGPSDNIASPFGWHDDNGVTGAEYTITRGNNVYAYEDANSDNLPGYSPNSATLQFNYPLDLTQAPLVNQDASITNLFYDCNRIHDVLYHSGFTEASGNFQQNNYGNGGIGNDYVKAEAFDGSGTNNANFATPADGSSGRMQMYLWTAPTPDRDGSFDNGIVAHEYGHGLSNRLTGGPSQASCLSNAEQGGEGWSDWLALMMTTEPSDIPAILSQARGIGTYALNQATNGLGIRRYRYSVDMAINPQTYADLATSGTSPHNKGEIWCDAIWDMSSFLMNDLGFSSDPTVAAAGNNIAMRLVLEGMKLQPCNPGYIDGRDAILLADNILYNDAHRCRIWEAFARRGMGYGASQGSSNSSTDQTVSFAKPPFCLIATLPPVAGFTNNINSVACAGAVAFTDTSTQAFYWLWNFGDQTTSTLQNPTHTYNTPGTYSVKLVVTNPLGSDSIFKTNLITVAPTYTANVTASPTTVNCGAPVQLNAQGIGSSVVSYNVSSIPYAPLTGTPINVALADDAMSSAKPIGFTFNFYGQNYTNFYISSNGFITFSPGQPAGAYGPPLPSSATPNNLIALAWNDLYPPASASAVSYFNTGVSPNQKLVITYNTRHYGGAAYPFVVQAILSEGSNQIEIHTTTISNASAYDPDATTTQGVENANGTQAVTVAGRNGTIFSASNDAFLFTPFIPYTYTWYPGNLSGATQTVNPIANSTYTVNVSDGSGCVQPFNTSLITVNPVTILIGGSSTFCPGGATTLDAGSGYTSYNWSTGATTQTITVNTAATFTVSVTNNGGCSGSGSVTTSISTGLTPVILGDISICAGSNSILDAGLGFTNYLWSTGATTQTISVNSAGTFTVTVSNGAGCTGTATTSTSINVSPTPTITGNTLFCTGTSSFLNTGIYSTYNWSTGATTQGITVNSAATFTVTITDVEGCSATATVATSFFTPSTPVISGTTSICTGSSSILDAGIYNAYFWSTGETTQTITVSNAQTFTVTVTDNNGCTVSTSATTLLLALPNPVITGASTICDGTSTNLDVGVYANYAWSTGSTSQAISITLPGTYTVTVTDVNGCTKSATKSVVSLLAITPIITQSPNSPVCSGSSVILALDSTVTFSQPGSITIPTTVSNAAPYPSSIVVSGFPVSGVTLKSVKLNGVSHTFPTDLDILLQSPNGTNVILMSDVGGSSDIVSQNFIFKDGSPALSVSGPLTGGTFSPTNIGSPDTWSAPGPGSFTQAAPALSMFTGNMNGTWNLLVTDDANIDGGTINSWSITFEAGNSNITYAWSPAAGLSNTSQLITTATPATTTIYTVTINDGISGCTTSVSATVNINSAPTPAITGNLAFCAGGSTSLDAGAFQTYNWSTGATTQSIIVNTTGTFTVTVSDANGCTGSTSATTVAGSLTPSITGTLIFCTNSGTMLNAGAGYSSYNWSSGASTQTIAINTSGTFIVTVSDALGCTGSTSVTTLSNPNPAPPVSGGNVTTCTSALPATLVDIVPNGINVNWWDAATGGNMLLANSATYTTSTPGIYYNEAVNPSTGCVSATRTAVSLSVNPNPTPSISGSASICAGSSTVLNAGAGYSYYNWSTGASTQTITVNTAGTFTVTVTNSFGCSASAIKTVTVTPNPTPVIFGNNAVCSPASTLFNAGAGYSTYSWSTGATVQSINASVAGTYTVNVTNSSGCSASATKQLSVSTGIPAQPGIISGPSSVCQNSNVNYSIVAIPGATSYTWTATSGATVSTGQGSTTVVINFSGSASNAVITVVANNICGTSLARALSYVVSSTPPTSPISMNGPLYGNCGKSGIAYNCSVVANAISYLWTVPAGVTIVSGQGSNAITVNYGVSFTGSGNLTVVAVNGCGTSAPLIRTTSAKTQQPVISGPNSTCPYQAGLVYSVAPVAGATYYTWTVLPGSTITNGQGTTSITLKWGGPVGGVIKCTANNACGASLPGTKSVSIVCKEIGSAFILSDVSLFPNPASTNATVQFDAITAGKGHLAVYDLVGQQLMLKDIDIISGNNQLQLDLLMFAKGVYTVKVIYNGQTRNCKLIVQ